MPIIEALLNNTFSLSRVSRTDDAQGGWVEEYSPVGTFRGRIYPVEGTERDIARSEEVQITHKVYTHANEDIRKGDLISLRTLVLEVVMVREPSMAQHHLVLECRERQEEGALTL